MHAQKPATNTSETGNGQGNNKAPGPFISQMRARAVVTGMSSQ